MRYFVLTDSGERYGPADIATLNAWAADRRLFPHQFLLEEMTGSRVAASSVPGLVFPAQAPVASPYAAPMAPMPPAAGNPYQPIVPPTPATAGVYRPGYAPSVTMQGNGNKEFGLSVLAAIGAPLIGFLSIYGTFIAVFGVQQGWIAYKKGQKLGIIGMVLSVIAVPISLYMRFVVRYHL